MRPAPRPGGNRPQALGIARALLVFGVFAMAGTGAAHRAAADGEAGLVVQHGDGSIDSYCLTFSGDGISGEEMLRRAAVPFEHVGGLVCSVGTRADEGCRGASSFESCTCRCRSGGSDCVYWSYFTRRYGQGWIYSAIGFAGQVARNGDLQAWRWGKGGPASAPAPIDVTFEQVCGHAPGAPPASTVPPTLPPASTTAPAPLTTFTQQPGGSPTALTPSAASATAPAPSTTAGAPSTAPVVGTPATPGASIIGEPAGPADTGDSPGARSLLAFAATAAALAAGIGTVMLWRRRS